MLQFVFTLFITNERWTMKTYASDRKDRIVLSNAFVTARSELFSCVFKKNHIRRDEQSVRNGVEEVGMCLPQMPNRTCD